MQSLYEHQRVKKCRRPPEHPYPLQSVFGLILLSEVQRVVDHGEAGRLAATKLSLEAESEHYVGGGLVELGELLPDLDLGYCGLARVQDVNDLLKQQCGYSNRHISMFIQHELRVQRKTPNITYHLLPLKQAVRHELPGPDCDCVVLKNNTNRRWY